MKRLITLLLFLLPLITFSQSFKKGDIVQIEWNGNWYPGKIEEVKGDKFLISYDGYDASWNETVGKERLKVGSTSSNSNSNGDKPVQAGNPVTSTASSNSHTSKYSSFKSVETMWDIVPSPDGKYVLATSAYGKLYILDANTLEEKKMIKITEGSPIFTSVWSPDGNYIAYADDNGIGYVLRLKEDFSYDTAANFMGYSSVYKMRFSPKSNMLLISGAPEEDYTKTQIDLIYVGNERPTKNILKSTNADHSISDIAWSNDGSKIAIGVSNKKKGILLYDSSGKQIKVITHTHDVTAVAFSPDGKTLASGGIDGKVTMWNLSNYTKTWSKNWKDEGVEYVTDVAYHPNGKNVAVCGRGGGIPIRLYNASTGTIEKEFGTANPVGNAIYYSSDAKNVYTAFTTYGDIAKVPVVCRYSLEE